VRAWGCLIVLSGHALGRFGAIFAAPALAIILMTCLVATLAASDELVSVIHAHQVGVGQSRGQLKIMAVFLGLLVQCAVLTASIFLAIRVANL
jgi:hypothetical protein